MLQITKQ